MIGLLFFNSTDIASCNVFLIYICDSHIERFCLKTDCLYLNKISYEAKVELKPLF